MSERKRYIDVTVINMDRKKNEKDRTIVVNTQDGKTLTIQDGATVTILEEVYENLVCAIEPIYALVKSDPDRPAKLVTKNHERIKVVKHSDFYYKDKEEVKTEVVKNKPGRKPANFVEALA
jgi:hypothetical protein